MWNHTEKTLLRVVCLVIFIQGIGKLTIKDGRQWNQFQHVSTGVPQGSLLGLRLFSIAANDLSDLSDDHEADLFVDDTTATCVLVIPLAHFSKRRRRWLTV